MPENDQNKPWWLEFNGEQPTLDDLPRRPSIAERTCEERLREAERALRSIVARLTAVDGESVARGHAAALTAREIARDALHAGALAKAPNQ